MLIEEAAEITGGRWTRVPGHGYLRGEWMHDSRRVQSGDCFVALRGAERDGHDYVAAAARAGAEAALVEAAVEPADLPQLVVADSVAALQALGAAKRREFGRPVVGITGSFGKTTVREMLGMVMGERWLRSRENFNNHLGLPMTLWRLDAQRHAGGIVEVGINRCGEMLKLAELARPDVVIFTGVGPAHLEQLGDLAGVAREKAKLAEGVPDGGRVFLPLALLEHRPFAALTERLRVTAVGPADGGGEPLAQPETIYHYNWTESADRPGTGELQVEGPGGPGRFNLAAGSAGLVGNAALVAACGRWLGREDSMLRGALADWRPYRQRGERIRCGDTEFYVDCYNANPASMVDSAERFRALYPDGEHLYIFGGMEELGLAAAEWHEWTGRTVPVVANSRVMVIGKWSEALAAGLRDQGIPGEAVTVVEDVESLREAVSGFRGAVFLKGSRRYGLERVIPEKGVAC